MTSVALRHCVLELVSAELAEGFPSSLGRQFLCFWCLGTGVTPGPCADALPGTSTVLQREKRRQAVLSLPPTDKPGVTNSC